MSSNVEKSLPLFVDLDGTLIRADIFTETTVQLLQKNVLYFFAMLWWLMRGGLVYLKRQIALRAKLDPALLPYNQPLVDYLQAQYQQGRRLILATAADKLMAEPVAKHLGIFEAVIATDGGENLSGKNKLTAIKNYCHGENFAYAGDRQVDLNVWCGAKAAIYVGQSTRLKRRISTLTSLERQFPGYALNLRTLFTMVRLHHWTKNLLIFIPLFTAYQFEDVPLIQLASYAFLAFGFIASAGYVVNDIFDLPFDRQHPTKHQRPLARGDIPVKFALCFVALFIFVGFSIAITLLPPAFTGLLIGYFLLSFLYSYVLKRWLFVDVILLAFLYMLRIAAGSAATGIALSEWLLAFAIFLFLSLALMKRVAELYTLSQTSQPSFRCYQVIDAAALANLGTASGYIAVLVFALYLNSPQTFALHSDPEILWLGCPLLLYWIGRAWLLTRRGYLQDDPLVFALKDTASYVVLLIMVGLFLLAH